jgi:hypothetical protein
MAVYGHDLFFTACSRLITAEFAPLFFPPMVHPTYWLQKQVHKLAGPFGKGKGIKGIKVNISNFVTFN